MTSNTVDGRRQRMRSTGIVDEVKDWVNDPDGRRRPSKAHARDEDTGRPLREVGSSTGKPQSGGSRSGAALTALAIWWEPRPGCGARVVVGGPAAAGAGLGPRGADGGTVRLDEP